MVGCEDGRAQFSSDEAARAWEQARQRALRLCLFAVAGSGLRHTLVLRGSLALDYWFGPRARVARDVDFVLLRQMNTRSPEADALLTRLRTIVIQALLERGVDVRAGEVAVGDISEFGYGDVLGRRIEIPWVHAGVRDVLHLDVAFDEILMDEAVVTALDDPDARADEATRTFLFASAAESLAWKLRWLQDAYPRAKDLYDAILLADGTPLSRSLLGAGVDFTPSFIQRVAPDWERFVIENPSLSQLSAEDAVAHLASTLRLIDD